MASHTEIENENENIVEEIVDNLRPLRAKQLEIEEKIRELLAEMPGVVDAVKVVPTPAETKASADGISKLLVALSEEIERPEAFVFRKIAALYNFSEEPARATLLEQVRATLEVLRSSRGTKAPSPSRRVAGGVSGHVDRAKAVCAEGAYDLIVKFSKRRPSGTVDGRFRTIAGLLFQALSGQQNVDLKRACDSQIRRRRRQLNRPSKVHKAGPSR